MIDAVGKVVEEKRLDKSRKICYTYDNLNRVTKRTVKDLNDVVQSEESYSYDAAGNLTAAPNGSFVYDVNNRLTVFNGDPVSYDLDGNLLSATLGGTTASFTYDSSNRLLSAGGNTYTYNAEGLRIRNLCGTDTTTYTYDTNAKLNRLLYRVKNGTVTKYVYGLGLIGEETQSAFKTYHFDSRGSTVAITDASGTVTDTFAYDAYGNLLSRMGTSEIIFGYCGKYGVITDENGLAYMRARYYVPEMRRFVNADLLAGGIADIASLNRYAYANGNPISNIDPYGLSPWDLVKGAYRWAKDKVVETANWVGDKISEAAEWVSDKASEIGRAVTGAAVTSVIEKVSVVIEVSESIKTAEEKFQEQNKGGSNPMTIAMISVRVAAEIAKDVVSPRIDDAIDTVTEKNSVLRKLRNIHNNRNKLINCNLPESYYTEQKIKKEGALSSLYHQKNQKEGENRKYVGNGLFNFFGMEFISPETVYYGDGTINDTPEDEGSVNFVSSKGSNVLTFGWRMSGHFMFDMLPYFVWGNSPEDSTTIIERIGMGWLY